MPNQLRSDNPQNSNSKSILFIYVPLFFILAIVFLVYTNYQKRSTPTKSIYLSKQNLETIIYPSPIQDTNIFDKNICKRRMIKEKQLLKQENKFIREFNTPKGIVWELQLLFDQNNYIGKQLILRKNNGINDKFIHLIMKDYPFQSPTVRIINPEIHQGVVPDKLSQKHPGESIIDKLYYFEESLQKNHVLFSSDKKNY